MNAYELADELQIMGENNIFLELADMLRKQENTIEELKQQIWALQNTLTNRTLRTYDGKLE